MLVESRARSKSSVLIVDDDRAALEAMDAVLGRDFYVHLAPDSVTADSLLNRGGVDLIVLDVMLREESGLDYLDRLREEIDVPVLLISGYGTKEIVAAALRSRASDYLDKPFNAEQLLDRARSLIAQGPRPSHISERIRQYIEHHYMRDWTVGTLAKALRLSVRTMRKMFRQRYCQSVMDFLEEVRITRARDLLATTDLPIQKVAAEVGYRDPHYFARVFRQRIGHCPRDFRSSERRESANDSD